MEEKEIEVVIDTEEIADFLFEELLKRGYSLQEEELVEIADVVFEFFIHKGICEEEE